MYDEKKWQIFRICSPQKGSEWLDGINISQIIKKGEDIKTSPLN
jgi:hypothetical protein